MNTLQRTLGTYLSFFLAFSKDLNELSTSQVELGRVVGLALSIFLLN